MIFFCLENQVNFQATSDEINKAYRKRCLIFHPDRHSDDEDKKQAEKIFVKLRRAHEGWKNAEILGYSLVCFSADESQTASDLRRSGS